MKFVIQRVTEASCTVDGNVTGAIQKGFLVLIGIADTDTTAIADKMIKKLLGLRIFEDADGKTNLSLADVGGSLFADLAVYLICGLPQRKPSFLWSVPGSPKWRAGCMIILSHGAKNRFQIPAAVFSGRI